MRANVQKTKKKDFPPSKETHGRIKYSLFAVHEAKVSRSTAYLTPTGQRQQSSTIIILSNLSYFTVLDVWPVTAALPRQCDHACEESCDMVWWVLALIWCGESLLWYGVVSPCDLMMLNGSRRCRPPDLGDDIGNSHILVLSSGGSHHLALLSPPGLCQHSSIWPAALCTAYQGKFTVLKKTMEPLISVRTPAPP